MKKVAIIIRGPSAVGKSTIAHLLHKKLPNSACIDIDVFKHMISDETSSLRTEIAHDVALHFTRQLAANKFNIILEEIFRDEHYIKYVQLFADEGYKLTSIFLSAPLLTLTERNKSRVNKVKEDGVISRLYLEITPRKEDAVIDVSNSSNEEVVEKILTQACV